MKNLEEAQKRDLNFEKFSAMYVYLLLKKSSVVEECGLWGYRCLRFAMSLLIDCKLINFYMLGFSGRFNLYTCSILHSKYRPLACTFPASLQFLAG
jgi:hypothetical protein